MKKAVAIQAHTAKSGKKSICRENNQCEALPAVA
jgi:hypothetical protein